MIFAVPSTSSYLFFHMCFPVEPRENFLVVPTLDCLEMMQNLQVDDAISKSKACGRKHSRKLLSLSLFVCVFVCVLLSCCFRVVSIDGNEIWLTRLKYGCWKSLGRHAPHKSRFSEMARQNPNGLENLGWDKNCVT